MHPRHEMMIGVVRRAVVAASVVLAQPLLFEGIVSAQESAGVEAGCDGDDAIVIEYALSANLELSDTPSGAGTYPIGPGTAVVTYEQHRERGLIPLGPARLVSYEMNDRFTMKAKALFWSARIRPESKTTVTRDATGVIAVGNVVPGRSGTPQLEWTDVHGARTDGTVTCEGSLCGKFGAPPPGKSELHIPPHDVHFKPWVFTPDMRTFTMEKTWMAHTESPKQTAHVSLVGREVRRACVKRVTACPPRPAQR